MIHRSDGLGFRPLRVLCGASNPAQWTNHDDQVTCPGCRAGVADKVRGYRSHERWLERLELAWGVLDAAA